MASRPSAKTTPEQQNMSSDKNSILNELGKMRAEQLRKHQTSSTRGPWTKEEMDAAQIPEAARGLAHWYSDLQDLRETLELPPQ